MRVNVAHGQTSAGVSPGALLVAAVPVAALIVAGIIFAYGWLDLHRTMHHALGNGSSVAYRDDVRIVLGGTRRLGDGTARSEVYLQRGTAAFVIAGDRHGRGRDAVTILTPNQRIEASAANGASFSVTVDRGDAAVVCARCRDDVRIFARHEPRTL